jgi:polyhydroxyalkanoate synthesis regulator protein
MAAEGCNKGVSVFGNLLCAPMSDEDFNLFDCSNDVVRTILCLLASVMGTTATNLNKIRLHAIQMSTDGNQTKVVITGYLYHATSAICTEASAMISKVTNTIETSGCATEEKQMFEELNREAAEVLVRLKELREVSN